jgi:hypothetical protein
MEDDDEIERAWNDVLAAWDDDQAHRRFLVLAESREKLAEAGRRYRETRDNDPARRAEAERRTEEILGRVLAQFAVRRESPANTGRRLEWAGLGLSIALIAAALWQIVR